jgi:hypothetical protein
MTPCMVRLNFPRRASPGTIRVDAKGGRRGPSGVEGGRTEIGWLLTVGHIPGSRHEARFAAGKHVQSPLNVALLRLRGFQSNEVAENFLLPAWRQTVPSTLRGAVSLQFIAEPRRHWINRPTFVVVIELYRQAHNVTDACARLLANLAVQIKKEAAVADGHQVDAPGDIRLAINLDAHRHRSAPIRPQAGSLLRAHADIRIYLVDFDRGAKTKPRTWHTPAL